MSWVFRMYCYYTLTVLCSRTFYTDIWRVFSNLTTASSIDIITPSSPHLAIAKCLYWCTTHTGPHSAHDVHVGGQFKITQYFIHIYTEFFYWFYFCNKQWYIKNGTIVLQTTLRNNVCTIIVPSMATIIYVYPKTHYTVLFIICINQWITLILNIRPYVCMCYILYYYIYI